MTFKRVALFDLDHTLWDFEKNSEETLYTLYSEFGLDKLNNLERSVERLAKALDAIEEQ